jgi:redox-sensitive bicupin YhaK (pirin superfamily)
VVERRDERCGRLGDEIGMTTTDSLRPPDAPLGNGSGFHGTQWSEPAGIGPVLMCDSYVMTAPTFPLHSHRHISAVAVVFEDTSGEMVSTDSVGTNHRFGAGDVHWTLAGSGVEHTQTPTTGSRIHAVQMFIDLPSALRRAPAQTFHLSARDVPVHEAPGRRVRLLVGTALGLSSPLVLQQDLLLIEGRSDEAWDVPLPQGWRLWVYDRTRELAGYTEQRAIQGEFLAVAGPSFEES